MEDKLNVRQLSPALEKLAKDEINEDSKITVTHVQALKNWLKEQPHLRNVEPTDQWLLVFLRGCKFNFEKANKKVETYYSLPTAAPEFFSNRDPLNPKLQQILKLGVFLPLKHCAKEDAPRPCLVRLGGFDPSEYHLSDIIKVSFMITEILMIEDDHFAIAGEEVIVDLNDVGLAVIAQWTPSFAKKVISCLEKSLPIRQRGNHILNTPVGFEAAYAIFQMFLSAKLRSRIKVHNQDYEAMNEYIPKSILPSEYGGEDGTLTELIDHWKAKVESYRDWFLQEVKQCSEENLRSRSSNSTSDSSNED